MPEFRIDVGDSNEGPIGFVAYIRAETKQKALDEFNNWVGDDGYAVLDEPDISVRVYINTAAVKISDVEKI